MLVPSGKGGVRPANPRKLLEAQVAKQIKDFCLAHGWRCLRMQSGMFTNQSGNMFRIGEPGMADQIYLRPSISEQVFPGALIGFWCENKRNGYVPQCRCASLAKRGKKGKCTACSQADWKDEALRAGYLILPGGDLDEFLTEYWRLLGWLHDARMPGQSSMFANLKETL